MIDGPRHCATLERGRIECKHVAGIGMASCRFVSIVTNLEMDSTRLKHAVVTDLPYNVKSDAYMRNKQGIATECATMQ